MSDEALRARMGEVDRKIADLDRRVGEQRRDTDYLLDAVRDLASKAGVHIGQRPRRAPT